MSACPYCHKKEPNTNENGNKDVGDNDKQDDHRWSCFVSFCSKKKDIRTKVNDVALNSEFIESGAIYKRRTTMQVQPETVVDNTPYRRITYNKAQHPLSKFKKGQQEVKYGFLLPPSKSYLKILLVFPNSDAVAEALSTAAKRLNFDVTQSKSYENALDVFQAKLHDLIIIDTRFSKTPEYEALCRSIRSTKGSLHCVVVAVVKKSVFEKDEVTVQSLLDIGYDKCVVETSNITACVNELIQIKHSDIRPRAQYATNQSLYVALDKCKDVVFITDDIYRLQYANRSSEKYLGFRQDEALGKSFQELFVQDQLQSNVMSSNLIKGREWKGQIVLKRKTHDPIVAICKAVPVISAGRVPTHYVLVMDLGNFSPAAELPSSQGRSSIHSVRRLSNDLISAPSESIPRVSTAKLSTLPLEAPITKIISLIEQAQDTSGKDEVVSALDKVMEMLRSTELYAIHMKEQPRMKYDEPVASDLIGALLSQQPTPQLAVSSRRSSNEDSLLFRPSRTGQLRLKIPAEIKDILESSLCWEFDIFRLEELCNRRPLQHLGMNLLLLFDVPTTLNCDEKTLYNWLTVIELNYRSTNTYHNSTHAADVMQATAGFLEKERMKSIMEPLDEATSLLAAAAHDLDHPGRSSAFLSNSDDPLAILYNDVTVLEMHHASLTFKLTLGDDRINIFKNLDRERYKIARHNVIDMILATEMTKHFEHLAKFVNVFCASVPGDADADDYVPLALPENITLVKRMMIKCADVSNPARPLRLCVEWARRIAEEYFQQTDEEKTKGLPVVMPMFDRQTCSIPKSQIGFVDYIINDMFEAWNAFIDMPELISYMRQNYIRWKELDEQGHTTLADVAVLQKSVLLSPMFPVKSLVKKKTDK